MKDERLRYMKKLVEYVICLKSYERSGASFLDGKERVLLSAGKMTCLELNTDNEECARQL